MESHVFSYTIRCALCLMVRVLRCIDLNNLVVVSKRPYRQNTNDIYIEHRLEQVAFDGDL